MGRYAAALSVVMLMAAFFAIPAAATEPQDTHDILLNCVDGVLTVYVGDHEVGHASFTQDKDDSTYQVIELLPNVNNHYVLIPGTQRVDMWVTLDGLEVDPWLTCITTTTTSTPTSSTSTSTTTVTSTTSTTSTVPVVETTTTTVTVVPSTTTTVANGTTTLPDTGVGDWTLPITLMGMTGITAGITLLALVRHGRS